MVLISPRPLCSGGLAIEAPLSEDILELFKAEQSNIGPLKWTLWPLYDSKIEQVVYEMEETQWKSSKTRKHSHKPYFEYILSFVFIETARTYLCK